MESDQEMEDDLTIKTFHVFNGKRVAITLDLKNIRDGKRIKREMLEKGGNGSSVILTPTELDIWYVYELKPSYDKDETKPMSLMLKFLPFSDMGKAQQLCESIYASYPHVFPKTVNIEDFLSFSKTVHKFNIAGLKDALTDRMKKTAWFCERSNYIEWWLGDHTKFSRYQLDVIPTYDKFDMNNIGHVFAFILCHEVGNPQFEWLMEDVLFTLINKREDRLFLVLSLHWYRLLGYVCPERGCNSVSFHGIIERMVIESPNPRSSVFIDTLDNVMNSIYKAPSNV